VFRARPRRPAAVNRLLGRPVARAVVWLMIAVLAGLPLMPMGGLVALRGDVTLVTVCTEDGVRQVALDAEGKSVPLHRSVAHHGGMCPFCVGHDGFAMPPPVADAPGPVLAGRDLPGLRPTAGDLPRPHFLTGRHSRAPPVAIV